MLDIVNDAATIANARPEILKMAWNIVDREGGFVDNKNDAGGATDHGVSLRFAKDQFYIDETGKHCLTFDLNGDGKVDVEDIKLVTPEIAVGTFLLAFYFAGNFNVLPFCIQEGAFDAAVMSGVSQSGKFVQQSINTLRSKNAKLQGLFKPLGVDGAIGAMTSVAAMHTDDVVGDHAFIDAFCDARDAYYQQLARTIPNDRVFLKGWLARSDSFREAA